MSLRGAWDGQAERWIRWAWEPGLDSYWRFHGRRFLELLPDPGQLTLDVGGGEGRLGRDLRGRGHRVVQVDSSMAMSVAAATHDEPVPCVVADAVHLPIRDGAADLVVAFMSLHDIDDLEGAVAEIARVLPPAGRLCLAVVHPMNSAGHFSDVVGERRFVVEHDYFQARRYREDVAAGGLEMSFHGVHRPLEKLSTVLEDHGFVVEALRELGSEDGTQGRAQPIPLFLHMRTRRA